MPTSPEIIGQRWPRILTSEGVPPHSHPHAIGNHTDVDLAGLNNGNVLVYNATAQKWLPGAAGGGGGSEPPEDPISGAAIRLEADAGLSASDGGTIASWDDQSGNGNHFVQSSDSLKPTFRASDSDDSLPFVEFDGSNDVLERVLSAAYTGTALTVYAVTRGKIQGATRAIISASVSGENEATQNPGQKFALQIASTGQQSWRRNSITYGFNAELRKPSHWQVVVGRWAVRRGRAIFTFVVGPEYSSRDLAATSLDAFNFDRLRLGAQYGNFGGTSNWAEVDVRAFLLYQASHTDAQVATNIDYLSAKWAADVLTLRRP